MGQYCHNCGCKLHFGAHTDTERMRCDEIAAEAKIAEAVAAEREACAELAESWKSNDSYFKTGGEHAEADDIAEQIAFEIRARGNGSGSEHSAPTEKDHT